MSKGAIELLKQVAYELDAYITGGYFPNTHVLLDKVENFLARHEHIEQEPVAWKVVDKTTGIICFQELTHQNVHTCMMKLYHFTHHHLPLVVVNEP